MREFMPTSLRKFFAIASIAFMLLSIASVKASRAQVSGELIGKVFDAAGHLLPEVKVTITNVESGNSVAVVTDENGTYRRPFLYPGTYTVTASKQGYSDATVTIRVPLNQTTEIRPPDITIRPAGTSDTTTQSQAKQPPSTQQPSAQGAQTESALLVNKTDVTRGGNFTALQLWTLPLGGGNTMRSFDELAFLLPGVAPPPYTPGAKGPGVGFGIGSAGQFSVNGMRARSNNFNIDGSDNNDPDVGVRRQGFVALVPQPIESVQEFQISTLLWNAEFGRNFGSQVNAVSRWGGNQFHGQAYGYLTHNKLNARNAFDFLGGASDGEDPLTRTQAGFVFGGPIKRDRAQFFASYEHLNIRSSTEQHFAVPSLAERRFLGAPSFTVLGPGFGLRSFSSSLGATPIGRNILSFFPEPNNGGGPFGSNTYTEILPSNADGNIASFRVTDRITTNNTLNVRYNFTDDNRVLPSVNRAIRSSITADTRTQDVSAIFDSGLTAALFNEARFSFGRTRLNFPEYPGNPFVFQEKPENATVPIEITFPDGSRQVKNFSSQTGPIGELVIEPFSPVGIDVFTFPQARASNTFQFADTMSWTVRQHSLKFGADIRHIQLNSRQDRNFRPLVVFNPGGALRGCMTANQRLSCSRSAILSGADYANLGLPSSILQTITLNEADSRIRLRFNEFNFFVNDNVRVRPNFTLDFGLRYEYNTVPREVDRRIEDALTLKTLPTSRDSIISNPDNEAAFDAAVAAYKRILDNRQRIYEPDKNNFGPHIGFAWSPSVQQGAIAKLTGGPGQTVIRGGYGIYFDAILGAVVSQSRNIFPSEIPLTISPLTVTQPETIVDVFNLLNPAFLNVGGVRLIKSGTLNQIGGSPSDFASLIGAVITANQFHADDKLFTVAGLSFTLPDKNLRSPYAQQWHLTLERQLFGDYLVSASYTGTKGTKLTRLTTPNGGENVLPLVGIDDSSASNPTVIAVGQFGFIRPEPFLGAFRIFEDSAGSSYHALQLEARKRYSHGYTFSLAYTWSHAIDDVSDVFPIAGAPILPQGKNSATDNLNEHIVSERADANFDIRHRFSASLVWDLPIYRNSTARAAKWLGGWQITSIFQAHTGQPFTLNLPFDDNLDGNLSDRPVSTSGLFFFHRHGSRRVAFPENSDLNAVNNFFGETDPGNQFRIGRNTVRADGFVNLDMALAKKFRFTESQNLEFKTEVFNVLNRANYGIPVRVIGAPGFGSSFDTVNPARIIQFALKYSF